KDFLKVEAKKSEIFDKWKFIFDIPDNFWDFDESSVLDSGEVNYSFKRKALILSSEKYIYPELNISFDSNIGNMKVLDYASLKNREFGFSIKEDLMYRDGNLPIKDGVGYKGEYEDSSGITHSVFVVYAVNDSTGMSFILDTSKDTLSYVEDEFTYILKSLEFIGDKDVLMDGTYWREYENKYFSIKYPLKAKYWDGKDDYVMVIEDENVIYFAIETGPYYDNIRSNLENRDKTLDSLSGISWAMWIDDVNNDNKLREVIKSGFGEDCLLGKRSESSQKGIFDVAVDPGSVLRNDGAPACFVNYGYEMKYDPSKDLLVLWYTGQGTSPFYTLDDSHTSDLMLESLDFK
ncbi:hypothetical protein ACFL16_01170, partial [Patescibacteria group bacterium]